eukprot:727420-Alexandrium_andersonii.AAC.1
MLTNLTAACELPARLRPVLLPRPWRTHLYTQPSCSYPARRSHGCRPSNRSNAQRRSSRWSDRCAGAWAGAAQPKWVMCPR